MCRERGDARPSLFVLPEMTWYFMSRGFPGPFGWVVRTKRPGYSSGLFAFLEGFGRIGRSGTQRLCRICPRALWIQGDEPLLRNGDATEDTPSSQEPPLEKSRNDAP